MNNLTILKRVLAWSVVGLVAVFLIWVALKNGDTTPNRPPKAPESPTTRVNTINDVFPDLSGKGA